MSDAAAPRSMTGLGSFLLFGGILLLLLCAIETTQGLPGMPRFWYANRTMWWAMAFGAAIVGARLLMPTDETTTVRWKPSRPGIRFQHVLVYTKTGCPLCDEAFAVLRAHQRWLPSITELVIDNDAELLSKYGTCVPVVLCDNKVRFRGRIVPALLQRLIEGTPPR